MRRFLSILLVIVTAFAVSPKAQGQASTTVLSNLQAQAYTNLLSSGYALDKKLPPESLSPGQGNGGFTNSDLDSTNRMAVADGYLMDDKHQLEPGDVISFRIVEDKKPLVSLTVTDSEELDAPYIGRVSVAGQTCRQLAAKLKTLLEKDYYYQATVIIGLDQVNRVRGKVFIWGEVRNQGAVPILFNHTLTLSEAILQTGGFNGFANEKAVKVVRSQGTGEGAKTIFEVNMAEVMEKGNIEKDIVLEPGDLIIVPARLIRF